MQRLIISLFALLLFACRQDSTKETPDLTAPEAKKKAETFAEHDQSRIDPYHWLSEKNDPEVINYLERENAYTEQMLAHTEELQQELYEELISRIEQNYESLPVKRNGYWYYVRYEEGQEYPLYCRKKSSLDQPEEIMLNVNKMAEGYEIYRLFQYFVSPDNQTIAYLVDTAGDRRNTLYFKNLSTGALLPDVVANCSYGGAWSADNQYFFYTLNDKTVRSYRVMRHNLGIDPAKDMEMYIEPDSTYSVGLTRSWDDRFILVNSGSTSSTEYWFIRADQPLDEFQLVQPRQKDLEYYVNSYTGQVFHILNNRNARNFKLSTAPVDASGVRNWKDLVPHQDGVLLNDYTVREKYLVIQQRSEALDRVEVIDRESGKSYFLDFGEDAYTARISDPTDEFSSDSIRYEYSSLSTPQSTFGYNLSTKQKKLLKQEKIGGGFEASNYESKRLWATARDGTEVPVSIVYRKEQFERNGDNPCLLYAYGSYGSSSMPSFRSNIISLLDRGFVFAIAHIRGGQEMGREWYEEGKLLKKKNTFYDFIDCARHLIQEDYTSSDGLFAMGGSAGGMLMGAVVNMEPDLFKGVVAYVPWMDVITDMMNPDLPLTTLEYEEWGDPNKKEYYDYMLSWSPYDNVKKAEYPAILATGGLNDTQVPYFSPAKWVQKIREHNTGTEPVLLKINMGAGHAGQSGRFQRQKETAMVYAFMLDQVEREMLN